MRFLKGPMGFITATMFLNFAGLTIIIPVIPYIVGEYTQNVALAVGVITSVAALCQFLATPALGYVSDMFGRRPVVILSLLGGAVGFVIFGIGGALWVLFLSRIIDGLSGGDTTAMYAYVADVFEGHERGRYYGILGAAAGLGFMAGPAIGGLAAQISLSTPLYVAAALSVLNAVWGYFVMPESLPPARRAKTFKLRHLNPFTQFKSVLSTFTIRILFMTSFVFFVGLIMQQSNFSVFLKDVLHWGPAQIGIVLTVVGLVDFGSEGYLTGKLLPILGEVRLVRLGTVLTGVGMILVGSVVFFPSIVLLYVAVIVYTVGDGLFEPAMTAMVSNATEPQMQGRVQGANQSIQSMARVVAPLSAGVLYGWAAYVPYFASALLMLVTLMLMLYFASSLRFYSK